MTPHQILIVAVRLLAIGWSVHILGQIGPVAAASESVGLGQRMLWGFLAFQFLMCIFLWLFPSSIASKLLRPSQAQMPPLSTTLADWQDLVFVAVGVFIVARAIPDLFYWVIFGLTVGGSDSLYDIVTVEQKLSSVVTVFELIFGLWLMFGSQGVRMLVFRLRHAGQGARNAP